MNEYRVFGPPGTGKTTYLQRQIEQVVSERGPDSVVVASFTKAAAVELSGRELPINPHNLGTLHALCYRQLGMPPIAETKVREFNQWQSIYALSGDGIDLDEPEQFFETDADKLFGDYQVARSVRRSRDMWPVDVSAFAKQWEAFKYEHGYIDFTDMIELALERGVPPPGTPSIGFFDEVQDFTLLELSLVRRWAEYLDYIVLAGDDDQCIYGFKGASPHAFLLPPISEDYKRVLGQSYRMPRMVHETTQQWIEQIGVREPKHFEARDEQGVVMRRADLRYRTPERIIDEAAELAEYGQSVMVIGSCSYQISPIVQELRKRGELFHNPYRRKRGDWNPLTPGRGVSTAARILAFLDRLNTSSPWTYADLRNWTQIVKRTGVFKRGAYKAIEQPPGWLPVPMEDLESAFEPQALGPVLRGDIDWLEDNLATDKQKSAEYALTIIRKHGADRLRETPRIIVGTIHSVKGGEADSVYLLPDLSPAGMQEYNDDDKRDGVIRQFYVGMSRARDGLVLCGQSSPFAVRWLQ